MEAWERTIDLAKGEKYSEALGYGYVTTSIRRQYSYLMIDELSNNFKVSKNEEPIYIRVQVPKEGNYKIILTIKGGKSKTLVNVFAQRRSCVVKNETLEAATLKCFAFAVNVGAIIPSGYQKVHQDTGIDLTLIGEEISCIQLQVEELVQGATLFMMGDSTMTDQPALYPYNPLNSYCGWGQMLPLFLKPEITVSNHAHSGKNTLSFRNEGHWQVIKDRLKKQDFVVMQFGHNDQKEKVLMPYEGYRAELKKYIAAVKAKQAYPILVTPLSRSLWNGPGHSFNDLLIEYAKSCKQIAEEEKIPLIDLHHRSVAWITEVGPIEAMKYFYPGDWTHTNDYGAFEVAQLVAQEIQTLKINPRLTSSIKTVPPDTIQEETFSKWTRPDLEEFYTLLSDWQLKNEWVKEIG